MGGPLRTGAEIPEKSAARTGACMPSAKKLSSFSVAQRTAKNMHGLMHTVVCCHIALVPAFSRALASMRT